MGLPNQSDHWAEHDPEKHVGTYTILARGEMAEWHGWAVYHWDMSHSVALFQMEDRPRPCKDDPGDLRFDKAIETCSPDFLEACGIQVPYDSGRDFYYGDNRQGWHPPVAIKLYLPKSLLELLCLV